jgi:hypothetical protein
VGRRYESISDGDGALAHVARARDGRARRAKIRSVVLACGLVAITTSARGEDGAMGKEQCVETNEDAQSLRQRGELRAARAQFVRCVAASCPRLVREDCAEQVSEIDALLPTLAFVVRDPAGGRVPGVMVAIDGEARGELLEDAPLAMDPGEHTFKFTADGYEPVEKRLVVREGTRGSEEILLAPTARPEDGWLGRDQRRVGYAVGGVGLGALLVGTLFGIKAKVTYDDATSPARCPGGLSSCDQAGVDGVRTARTEAAISTVAFVGGAALLAGGIALVLTTPIVGPVAVAPSVDRTTAGVRLGGVF